MTVIQRRDTINTVNKFLKQGGCEMLISIERLNLAQAKACMSSKELQEAAKISDVTLSRIRNGEQKPRLQTIGKLARALGIDPAELIIPQEIAK